MFTLCCMHAIYPKQFFLFYFIHFNLNQKNAFTELILCRTLELCNSDREVIFCVQFTVKFESGILKHEWCSCILLLCTVNIDGFHRKMQLKHQLHLMASQTG